MLELLVIVMALIIVVSIAGIYVVYPGMFSSGDIWTEIMGAKTVDISRKDDGVHVDVAATGEPGQPDGPSGGSGQGPAAPAAPAATGGSPEVWLVQDNIFRYEDAEPVCWA